MKAIKQKRNLQFLLWSAVLMLSVGGNIFLASPVVSAQTVYITRTGSKYHTHKCGNGTYFPASLSEAQSQGLTPCIKCFGGSSPSSGNNNRSTSRSSQSKSGASAKPIKINKTSLYLIKGQSSTLKIRNATKKVRWKSSKKSVATISSKGKVTAKRKGKTTITASVGSQKKRCKVTVETPKLSASNITLDVGKSYTIRLSGCSHSVSWSSSNSAIAKVKAGKITAKLDGTATITAKVHNRKYKCKVRVNELSADQLILKQDYVKMGYDEEFNLPISTNPRNLLEEYGFSAWSSDENIVYASEDPDDTVLLESGTRAGTATVYISIGNITKKCKVEVGPESVESISLYTNSVTLKPYETKDIFFNIMPTDAIYDYEAICTSSNENVVKAVSKSYLQTITLTAVGEGEADVTITVGDKSASCHVVVKKPQINSLKFSDTRIWLNPYDSRDLFVDIDPHGAEYYYDPVWSSSDETIVTVKQAYYSKTAATISPVGEGEADVTVTIGDKSASCHVVVRN